MGVPGESLTLEIRGIVQGVGFRPFVYRLANEMNVRGYVTNTSDGVLIRAENGDLDGFVERVRTGHPPLARITRIDITVSAPAGFERFEIIGSSEGGSFTLLSPDIAMCTDCSRELFDPSDRRYRYPFINCTNCGPRYSITESVPYDRSTTTMRSFAMCPKCSAEYHDPSDRRFHAQPNACPDCGPAVVLVDSAGSLIDGTDPVAAARKKLSTGGIVAVKGIGGFHLACDALNAEAVDRLRERKRRSNKPFGLMAADVEVVRRYCHVSDREKDLLLSPRRPIVLLSRRTDAVLPESVAPGNRYAGCMLPYTPLHEMLLSGDDGIRLDLLVMTSANLAEEPIIARNEEAREKLARIADAFLEHNRDIFMRVDDSVLRCEGPDQRGMPGISFIRRSRGYAPEPILVSSEGPDVLGCGADLKNTFTVLKANCAIVSQHIGDMENYESLRFYEETLENLSAVYRVKPAAVGIDLHPGYFSSQWARGRSWTVPLVELQHHYSHIMSVVAEHGLRGKVIGVAFDGTGYGTDGTLWGGEFLVADIQGFSRAAHLVPVPLPGGEKAIREPWRMAVSVLNEAASADAVNYLDRAGLLSRLGAKNVDDMLRLCGAGEFSPSASGAGRYFDAAASLLGLCDHNTFEGEASMALEAIVDDGIDDEYPVDIAFADPMRVDLSYAFLAMADDIARGADRGAVAAKFHNTMAAAVVRVVQKLSLVNNTKTVAVSGGVFQNRHLSAMVMNGLRMIGMQPYSNQRVPCNDAGISLGQAYAVRERLNRGCL